MTERTYGFHTQSIHAGQKPDSETHSRAVPIYQTTSFVFDDTQHGADLFSLSKPGNIYTRIMNPTTAVFEDRMAALEGGVGALATASGSAAITYAIMNLTGAGGHIVAAATLYGGTYNLLARTLPHYGINTTFADPDDPNAFAAAIRPETKAIFVETIGNPTSNIADLEAISAIAKKFSLPLLVDNTFGTPYLVRPIEHGADIVIHSATKFIGGHGTSIGGVIIDAGRFDYASDGRFPLLSEPDPSYQGLRYAPDLGNMAFILRARVSLLRDTGAAISPFNAWLMLLGLETLPLRMQRHVANAMTVAEFLEKHPKVSYVHYPGLPGNRYHDLAKKYLPRGAGSIFSFGIRGGRAEAGRLIDSLELFSHLANVADTKSLVIHPAGTTHAQLDESQLKMAGIGPELIRLSIGLEDVEDLIADLDQALDQL